MAPAPAARTGVARGFVGWGESTTAFVARSRRSELVAADDPPAAGAGAGSSSSPSASSADLAALASAPRPAAAHLLGEWRATSIAGNDLLSSCLYTAGICASYAGKMAPLSLLLVSVMLYFFRFVYAEVVTAMPINGGSYTALSNMTSKRVAALAACLSLISYVATAVVSAESAVFYVALLVPQYGIVDEATGACPLSCQFATVGVLAAFALLSLLGMSESANVAAAMFVLHVFALALLVVWSLVWAVRDDWALFRANLATDYPAGADWSAALYFGYSSALLGITGFETAANYVEEMKDSRTYVATLRNMWASVAFFNPVLAALAMAVLPMSSIYTYTSNLLGPMANVVGGPYLQAFICIDGAIVLAGSVLTAYVGIGGLVRRMALDRCLPDALLARNSCRGTYTWVILGFFGVSSSLVFALNGNVQMLGSVYNLAFLSVMTCFAVSCVVLKWKRPELPRMVVASGATVAAALVFVLAGLAGNVVRQPQVVAWFLLYFGVAVAVVFGMFNRTAILGAVLALATNCLAGGRARRRIARGRAAVIESHDARERELADPRRPRDGAVVALDADAEAAAAAAADEEVLVEAASAGGGGGAAGGKRAAGLLLSSAGVGAPLGLISTVMSLQWAGGKREEKGGKGSAEKLLGGGGGGGDDDGLGEYAAAAAGEEEGEPEEDEAPGDLAPSSCGGRLLASLAAQLEAVNSRPCVFFAKAPDFEALNKAILYVRANEQTARLVVVHVVDDAAAVLAVRERWRAERAAEAAAGGAATPRSPREVAAFSALLEASLPPLPASAALLREQVRVLDAVYPKLRVDFLVVRGTAFGPPVCRWAARRLGVGSNMLFMGAPDARFGHRFATFGGVRVITRAGRRGVRAEGAAHSEQVLGEAAARLRGSAAGGGRGLGGAAAR